MKHTRRAWLRTAFLAACFAASFAGCSPPDRHDEPLREARITVDGARVLGDVSPLIYGAAIEWTERGNGILDAESGEPRPEILDALKPLSLPILRFPGGILADHYHWRDGVGPRASRPAREHPMDGTRHANDFGTDEFIRLCRALDARPLVTANVGTGSLDELLAWQRHFEAGGLPVRHWELGNEIYLAGPGDRTLVPGNDQRIYHPPERYAEKASRWARALKEHDPRAQIGAIVGTYNTSEANRGWLDVTAQALGPEIDFIALHNAFAPMIHGRYAYRKRHKRHAAYRAMFAHTGRTAEDLRAVRRRFLEASGRAPRIAVTEHFPLFGLGGSPEQLRALLDQSRTLASALYTAGLLHVFIREEVWLANHNLALSPWFGALVIDGDDGPFLSPAGRVYELYRGFFGDRRLAVDVDTPTVRSPALGAAPETDLPLLDAAATKGADGHLYLAVINRALERPVTAALEIGLPAGTVARVRVVTGPSPESVNGPALTDGTRGGPIDQVTVRESDWTLPPDGRYVFPASSVTILRWSTDRGRQDG